MSFYKTSHICARCGGAYEIWEHNESGEKSIHRLNFPSTKHKIVCMCREPEPTEEKGTAA